MTFFNAIRRGDFSHALRRLLSLEGVGIQQLSPELQAVIDLWSRPEFIALKGGTLGISLVTVAAAGVGNLSATQLYNPTGSNLLITVRIHRPSQAVGLYFDVAALATLTTVASHRDLRRSLQNQASKPSGQIRTGSGVGANGTQIWNLFLGADGYRPSPWLVLAPGSGIATWGQTDNQAHTAYYEWVELPAQPEEIRLG